MVPFGFADLYHELYRRLRDRSTETEMRDTVRRLAAFYRVDTAVNSIGPPERCFGSSHNEDGPEALFEPSTKKLASAVRRRSTPLRSIYYSQDNRENEPTR